MRLFIASLVLAAAACGPSGKTTTTTTDRVETTGGPVTTATTDPEPEPAPTADITLDEAEVAVSRVVELMGQLADSLSSVEDCGELVPAYEAWNATNMAEQMQLEEIGAKIPAAWANGELVDYYLKMEEHSRTLQQAISDCRCDADVQAAFELDAEMFECPPPAP